MKNFLNRLNEPSTWAGLAALSILFDAVLPYHSA
jgi:hypothetical protein